ncbi:MAG TPA: serine/threonine-protein kinase [Baekduia sp.]|nr:serine/threonine-protein kinase [Baekduia sp.]
MPVAQPQVDLPPRYRVVRHIANGGMAAVYAAEDSVLERLVAIKVLGQGYAADPAARRRFTREARAAARVSDHPHVVTIFDTGEHDGTAFIVMELRAGGSLADRLRRGDPVPTPTAVRWLREAASALDAAHAAQVVHRDVKPGNLLLDEQGRLAVGDFGIASLADDTSLTQAGQVLGTAAYLSPEQATGQPATPASDRYSLAVVAYELLCGRKPFDGDTPVAQARAHVEVDPPTPTGPCQAAAAALKHGLAKDPAQRPATAMAFIDELDAALGDHTAVTRSLPPTDPTKPVAGERAPRRPRAPRTPVPVPVPAAAAPSAPARTSRPRTPAPETAPPYAPPPRRRTGSWLLGALAAVALAAGAAGAVVLANSQDGGGGGAQATRSGAGGSGKTHAAKRKGHKQAGGHKQAKPKKAKQQDQPAQAQAPAPDPTTAPAAETTPAPVDTSTTTATDQRTASQLNDAGYALLPGDPEQAIPLLQQSVTKYRAEGDTSSLGYAYALYNLGHALRLGGRPDEAIPYLQERLQVSDNQRGTVKKELAAAERDAGQTG